MEHNYSDLVVYDSLERESYQPNDYDVENFMPTIVVSFIHSVVLYYVYLSSVEPMLYYVSNHLDLITHCNYYDTPVIHSNAINDDVESIPIDVCSVCNVV